MTLKRQVVFYLCCDECPPDNVRVTENVEDLPAARRITEQSGWKVERKDGRLRHVCPRCLRARKQRRCGDRPQGHVWRKNWIGGEADDDGWIFAALRGPSPAVGYWQRLCQKCGHLERTDTKVLV